MSYCPFSLYIPKEKEPNLDLVIQLVFFNYSILSYVLMIF